MKFVKVLLVSVSLERRGGVSQYVSNLMGRLKKKNVKTRHFAQKGLLMNLLLFIHTLKKDLYDIVHINPSLGSRALLRDFTYSFIASVLGYKTLFFIHGWDDSTHDRIKISKLYTTLFKFFINRQDKIVVLDYDYKNKLISLGCHSEKIHVSSTMVDTPQYIPPSRNKTDDTIRLVFCSRIEAEKGIFQLLDSLEKLPEDIFQRVKLTYIGIGSGLNELEERVREKDLGDHVELTGFVSEEEKIRHYREGDIFVFPSYHGEGFPTVILEAMAAGLPVLTTDIGGTKRAIEEGKNGLFFSDIPPSPKEIADTILKLLGRDMEKISKNNIEKVSKYFDTDVVVNNLIEIYESVVPHLKLLLVGPRSPTGGVGGMLESEYDLLKKSNFKGLDIFDITSLKKDPFSLLSLIKKIKNSHVVHIHCSFANIHSSFQLIIPLFISKIFNKKSLITYHRGEAVPYFRNNRCFVQLVFSFPDIISVPSNMQSDIFVKYDVGHKESLRVLYNFIKPYYLLKSREIKHSDKTNCVITTGEVSKNNISRKGFDDFLKVAKSLPKINFILVGKLEDAAALKLKKQSPPNLNMKGFVPEHELAEHYAQCKAYLQLSRSESFGVSMVEAMSFGCVPVAYDTGALPEVVGGEGYIVAYKDLKAVKETTVRIIEGDYEKDPRSVVLSRYTPNVYLKNIKEILNELA